MSFFRFILLPFLVSASSNFKLIPTTKPTKSRSTTYKLGIRKELNSFKCEEMFLAKSPKLNECEIVLRGFCDILKFEVPLISK
jgi:hypothetical protein